MTQIKKVKTSEGVQFYPQTHTKAVIDDNGYTTESRLGAMQDEINNLQEGVVVVGEGMTPVPSDLAPTENSSNWVTSGGVYSAISEIKNDIKTIISSLGNYAFVNGKPSLPWMGDLRIINNLSNVISSNYKEVINTGESYITILKGSGMYALDDSSVVVTMGGTDITSSAYNTSTHIISISNVTGDITITASGITYIASGLAFQLDGLEQGGTDGVWTDLAGGVVWTPYGATKSPDGWYFDGSSYMLPDSMATYDPANSTVEVCINSEVSQANYFLFVDGGGRTVLCYTYTYVNKSWYITKGISVTGYGSFALSPVSSDWGYGRRIVSYNGAPEDTANAGYLNGVGHKAESTNYSADGVAILGCRVKGGEKSMYFTGKIHSMRIYNRRLTSEEMLHNQIVDNIRFNMGLKIG